MAVIMAFKEAGTWKVGTDGMYDLVYDPSRPDVAVLRWQDKCFMEVEVDEDDDPSDFTFDETDLRWMQCYKPWLAAMVHGKTQEDEFFENEDDAKACLKQKYSVIEEADRKKASFYLVRIDGSYYYEKGRGVLIDKVDPSAF